MDIIVDSRPCASARSLQYNIRAVTHFCPCSKSSGGSTFSLPCRFPNSGVLDRFEVKKLHGSSVLRERSARSETAYVIQFLKMSREPNGFWFFF